MTKRTKINYELTLRIGQYSTNKKETDNKIQKLMDLFHMYLDWAGYGSIFSVIKSTGEHDERLKWEGDK